MDRLVRVLLCTVLSACAAPRERASGEHHAISVPRHLGQEVAQSLAFQIDEVALQVAELLEAPLVTGVEFMLLDSRFVKKPDTFGGVAATYPPKVVLGLYCLEEPQRFVGAVAHELTHVHLRCRSLPYLIEEALAQYVALHCENPRLLQVEMQRKRRGRLDPELLNVNYTQLTAKPVAERRALYEAGFELVRRFGFENLIRRIDEGVDESLQRELSDVLEGPRGSLPDRPCEACRLRRRLAEDGLLHLGEDRTP